MTGEQPSDDLVEFSYADAELVWDVWALGDDDILARAAFDRAIRAAIGLGDDGLYFRPGGWTVNLSATMVRATIAAGVLAALFHLAGIDDLDREIAISTAGFVAAMEVRPARLTRQDTRLADLIQRDGRAEHPLSAKEARRALPRARRREVTIDDVSDSLDRLVAAGLADREGADWVVRAPGDEAWFRLRVASN